MRRCPHPKSACIGPAAAADGISAAGALNQDTARLSNPSNMRNNGHAVPPDWGQQGHLELEVKLLATPSSLRRVLGSAMIQSLAAGPSSVQTLVTVYYDTPANWFALHNLTLRVRWDGEKWVQELKARIEAQEGIFRRWEWEQETCSPTPSLAPFTDDSIGISIPPHVAASIIPVFETRFSRTSITLEVPLGQDGSARIVVAFDEGVIVAGTRQQPIAEIELELLSGPEEALGLLAKRLTEAFDLQLGYASKAERGYHLLAG